MRVCYFGTYRAEYARNQILIEGLRQNGIEVVECHAQLWLGVEDRVQAAQGGWARPGFFWRVLRAYVRLLWRYHSIKDYDVLVVGYPGQYDVFVARWLSWLRRKPLVWDVLNSMVLITLERGIASQHPLTARLIRGLERLATRLPDMLILDSAAFVAWFQQTHGVKPERFRLVPIGADDTAFQVSSHSHSFVRCPSVSTFHPSSFILAPSKKPPQPMRLVRPIRLIDQFHPSSLPFQVLYYGTYIPNHGVDVIVEAARLLEAETSLDNPAHEPICSTHHPDGSVNRPSIQYHFDMVGEGPEREKAMLLAQTYGLKNITFIPWLAKSELAQKIAGCDVCLGTFGDTVQASLTNNNKIYEAFALYKPVITGSSPSMPDVLQHGEHLYLCPRGDPQALAGAIKALQGDAALRERLGENGYRIFHTHFDVKHIGAIFAAHLREAAMRVSS